MTATIRYNKLMQQHLSAPRIIERPHLRNLLLDSLEKGHILLTAAGGYGKSVVLRDLARQLPHAHLITLSQADLDLSLLKTRLTPLLTGPNVILLDDVHHLTGGVEACRWLQQQLQQRQQRWILAGRTAPFSLEMLLLSGQVIWFGKEVLAFSLSETAVLLSQSEDLVTNWHERLSGWSLAISLLSRLPTNADPLPATEAHLFNYLTQAVFAQLPPQLKQFMQLTAVPLHFNHALAAHLWGNKREAKLLLNEIIRTDLYIQPTNPSGTYRYHDLIRDYLLQDFEQRKEVAETAVSWFWAHEMVETAVEQALDADLKALAAQQMSQIPLRHFHSNGSYFTYRRWVQALDDEALSIDPVLLIRLANVVQLIPGYKDEGRDYTERALRLATEQGNGHVRILAQTNLALWHYKQGELEIAHRLIMVVLDDPDCKKHARLFALRIATLILSDSGYYAQVRSYFEEAITLAYALNTRNEPVMNQANMAAMYLLPLGKVEEAEEMLTAVLTHFANAPGWMAQYLTYWCELQVIKGEWDELTTTLDRLTATLKETAEKVENLSTHTQIWQIHYQTIQAIVQRDEAQIEAAFARYTQLLVDSPLNHDCLNWLICWHLRRRGKWHQVLQQGDRALAHSIQFINYRAKLTLEMDIARGMQLLAGDLEQFALLEETKLFIKWRSRHQLLRLRALLTIVCWHQGDWRWQRHWTAVTRMLKKPAFAKLLTQRDPELGVYFWRIGLDAAIEVERTTAVLAQIGQYKPLLPLLHHKKAAIRRQTAYILATIGDEQAMVGLTAVLSTENHKPTRQAIECELIYLENQPPPRLKIQLMGDFALWRGDQPILATSWHRPIVLRLFQYFVINAGQSLPKEKILDELWPDADPAKAWVTFRTVYSRLRKLLEPHMRPKTANRYITLNGDSYTFDPDGQAEIDVVQFQKTVRYALQNQDETAISTIPNPLVNALQSYAPLLPNQPYAEWLLEPRQRVQELYIEGCLLLARAYLRQGKNNTAVTWAKQTVTVAPWLEEAYQLLMRGYARQGQRTMALRVYEKTAVSLKQELDLKPSPLTQQLANTLRAGKPI